MMFLSRRRLLQTSLAGLGALAVARPGLAATGRVTDTVRLTWGVGLLSGVAKERGEFEKTLARDGIKVEWLGPFPNHAPTLQAVTGGSADVSFGGSSAVALAAMIAGSPLLFAQFLVLVPRSTSILAKDESGINRLEDLVGKSVAVNRSGLGELVLVAALEKRKIDRAAVKLVYLNPGDAGPALAAGKVDAWSVWSPLADVAREQYKAHDLFTEAELDFEIDFNGHVVTRKFAEDNPDLIRAVNAAYAAEAQWAGDNAREAETIIQRKASYSEAIRDHFIAQKRRFKIFDLHDQTFLANLQKSADWLAAHQVLPETITVAEHTVRI